MRDRGEDVQQRTTDRVQPVSKSDTLYGTSLYGATRYPVSGLFKPIREPNGVLSDLELGIHLGVPSQCRFRGVFCICKNLKFLLISAPSGC